jgi:hypothetical protein
LEHESPGTGARGGSANPSDGAEALADDGASGQNSVSPPAGEQALRCSGRADQRQRQRQEQRHCHEARIVQRCVQWQRGRCLDERANSAYEARSPERTGDGVVIERECLHKRVSKQGVDDHPEQNMQGNNGRADANLVGTNDAGDQEG